MSETKIVDISNLVDEKYLDFFTHPVSDCEESNNVYCDFSDYPDIYPAIMIEFRENVIKALIEMDGFEFNADNKPRWAKMRDKYFDGKPYVQASEMIEKLDEFDYKEIIAFLHFCVCFKERFITGTYGVYAEKGLIGQLLLRLKELSNSIDS